VPSPTASSLVQRVQASVPNHRHDQVGKTPAVVADLKRMLQGIARNAGRPQGPRLPPRRTRPLDVGDLDFSSAGLIATLRRDKNDQEAAGRRIGIPFGSSEPTCPVLSVQAWLESARISEGPISPPMDRFSSRPAARLSDKAVALIVKRRAKAVGLDPKRYAGHSLRAGLAASAAAGGAERAGDHVADGSSLRRYGHEVNLRRVNVYRKCCASGRAFNEQLNRQVDRGCPSDE